MLPVLGVKIVMIFWYLIQTAIALDPMILQLVEMQHILLLTTVAACMVACFCVSMSPQF